MPLPRLFQPDSKRPKLNNKTFGPNINDLDDYCLSQVLRHALILSSQHEEATEVPTRPPIRDNNFTEKNLSLVSKRWYLLTQALVALHGVHKVELGNAEPQPNANTTVTSEVTAPSRPKAINTGRNIPISGGSQLMAPTQIATKLRPPGVLTTRNQLAPARMPAGFGSLQRSCTGFNLNSSKQHQVLQKQANNNNYDIGLFLSLMPKLRKYNHLILGGKLKCDQLRKLLIALDATRVERLELKLTVQRDDTLPSLFALMPERLGHIRELSFCWHADSPSRATCNYSNALNWTIFQRAVCLRRLAIYLQETEAPTESNIIDRQQQQIDNQPSYFEPAGYNSINNLYQSTKSTTTNPIETICADYLKRCFPKGFSSHPELRRLVFYRNMTGGATGDTTNDAGTKSTPVQQSSQYSQLVKHVLSRATHLDYFETNDSQVIEHLLELSKRVCTRVAIRELKFAQLITDMKLLQDLLDLRTESLSLAFESLDQVGDILNLLEQHLFSSQHHLVPLASTRCRLRLNMRDQKFTDAEDKIKRLSQLCRLAELTIRVASHMRVSIDCCHLMWSVGRSLSQYGSVNCLFRIYLQTSVNVNSTKAYTEISVPFGDRLDYKINSTREDPARHREILRALKRDCYHSFVKSVRDSVTTANI